MKSSELHDKPQRKLCCLNNKCYITRCYFVGIAAAGIGSASTAAQASDRICSSSIDISTELLWLLCTMLQRLLIFVSLGCSKSQLVRLKGFFKADSCGPASYNRSAVKLARDHLPSS